MRRTQRQRMRAKLREIKAQLQSRRHAPLDEQGQWLASVVRGHFAYYGVPTNTQAICVFRDEVTKRWRHALRRRGNRAGTQWRRMHRLAREVAPTGLGSSIPGPTSALTLRPEPRAECGSPARSDLCGGPRATGVPTATLAAVAGQWQKRRLEVEARSLPSNYHMERAGDAAAASGSASRPPAGWSPPLAGLRALLELANNLPRDHQVLDLCGPLVDPQRAHRAVEAVDRMLGEHAAPAENLHGVVDDALRRLGGVEPSPSPPRSVIRSAPRSASQAAR